MEKDWTLSNPPPEGHKDVGRWAWELFENAVQAREREELPRRWLTAYNLYRRHNTSRERGRGKNVMRLNLFFANVERTVANVLARKPNFSVFDYDGDKDGVARGLSNLGLEWWKTSNQQRSLTKSTTSMEIYGTTFEKAVWNPEKETADFIVMDPFSAFPAPGYYDDISTEAPYFCHAYPESIDALKSMFKPGEEITASDVYSLLGEERIDWKPVVGSNYEYRRSGSSTGVERKQMYLEARALAVEVWVRDRTKESIEEIVGRTPDGEDITQNIMQEKYPGGLRKITITNDGGLVLDDRGNPNINPYLPKQLQKQSYLYKRMPFKHVCSYPDVSSTFGFSAIEQVGDIGIALDRIVSRLTAYVERAMYPPLIIPKNCGITTSEINNKPNLLLRPDTLDAANAIRFVQVPNLPASFLNVFNLLVGMHDRIYQIEDADRGAAPGGVIAASAIVALQERNAALIQKKIISVEDLITFRGNCFLSFNQNFGVHSQVVEVDGEQMDIRGVDLAGFEFGFVVEPGSTMPKTQVQAKEEAKEAYKLGIIDRQAYMELVNFPNYKEILERVSEGQLGQAITILQQAGLDEETAQELFQFLQQQQFGKSQDNESMRDRSGAKTAQAERGGIPKARQGGSGETDTARTGEGAKA